MIYIWDWRRESYGRLEMFELNLEGWIFDGKKQVEKACVMALGCGNACDLGDRRVDWYDWSMKSIGDQSNKWGPKCQLWTRSRGLFYLKGLSIRRKNNFFFYVRHSKRESDNNMSKANFNAFPKQHIFTYIFFH